MSVLVLSHADCSRHVTPPGHPERVDRLAAVERGLTGLPVLREEAPLAALDEVTRCHPRAYAERVVAAVPQEGWAQLDGDTFLSPGSLDAALRAVGGMAAAVDAVVEGRAKRAFLAARPPGHHAETQTAMGFCLFGTVAIGAKRALDLHGLSRVAVLDFDVHHGNGTQALLWDEPRVRFVSSHEMPLYPGTGSVSERGAHGQITNLPLRAWSGGAEMWRVWEPVLDDLRRWQPELVLVSAGFDAHKADPLSSLTWKVDDFAWLTGAITDLADDCCGGRVVSALEGGYDLDALAASVAAHVGELARGTP